MFDLRGRAEMNRTEHRVVGVIAEYFCVDRTRVYPDSPLSRFAHDDKDIAGFARRIVEEFGLEVSDDRFNEGTTASEVVDFVTGT